MEDRFNLIDEPWIPVVDVGRVSLRDVFDTPEYRALGGTPLQKIALTKFLLALAQAAATPDDTLQWHAWGWQGMSRRVLEYLEQWHHAFYLFGERPFLQMPAIAAAEAKPFGAVMPDVATGNTTVLTQSQAAKPLHDADKAVLLITLMGCALGGKKADNRVVLSPGYQGKYNDKGNPSTGKPGPTIAHMGLLHSFCLGDSLMKSVWLNVFSHADIAHLTMFPKGLGAPPWERMPDGEACPVALELKQSLVGRLIPLCRFCLFCEGGIHYSEGIAHDNYNNGVFDPSITTNLSGKKIKVFWANPEKRPWRELTSLLSFIGQQGGNSNDCIQLRLALGKAARCHEPMAIWSGGLRVSSKAGEQFVSGSDDCVESLLWLLPEQLGETWFTIFQQEMSALDAVGKSLYGAVLGYFKALLVDNEKTAAQATNLFWQLCERDAQRLIMQCDQQDARYELRRTFARYAVQAFDRFCPNQTARQMDAWAKAKPSLGTYLKKEEA
ncbi:type I-E CRISPR-associated protein Cse1/CasA [Oleidesulfovibrio alaskensis]|uniref:type I-E CRISPR-associated protein Cse1/CasA n=1 Tax=Oleidesulfovibrio alaskensis TaxID=58180 RepID=UPI001A46544B|nr:type I-E CRISPR-associated protein Cse1/CasA [Oleidesulfovibrio alaskensis]MBL3580947.1 type I-E CRISPR-associated protein Cse1/CasA [Oleidesulfovibrio alaskensis]